MLFVANENLPKEQHFFLLLNPFYSNLNNYYPFDFKILSIQLLWITAIKHLYGFNVITALWRETVATMCFLSACHYTSLTSVYKGAKQPFTPTSTPSVSGNQHHAARTQVRWMYHYTISNLIWTLNQVKWVFPSISHSTLVEICHDKLTTVVGNQWFWQSTEVVLRYCISVQPKLSSLT